jgi:hypothetical protein
MTNVNEKDVKVTKRMCINSLLQRADLTSDEIAYLTHELELLDKKNSYKANKKAVEDNELKNTIFEVMKEQNKPLTCTAIASKMIANGFSVSPQKLIPQLKRLIDEDCVKNEKVKNVSLYSVVG